MTIDTDLYQDIGALKADVSTLKDDMKVVLDRTAKLDSYRARSMGWYAGAGTAFGGAWTLIQFFFSHFRQ